MKGGFLQSVRCLVAASAISGHVAVAVAGSVLLAIELLVAHAAAVTVVRIFVLAADVWMIWLPLSHILAGHQGAVLIAEVVPYVPVSVATVSAVAVSTIATVAVATVSA